MDKERECILFKRDKTHYKFILMLPIQILDHRGFWFYIVLHFGLIFIGLTSMIFLTMLKISALRTPA